MSERCPSCFHFQRFCNCPAVVEAERIVAEAGLSQWLRPSAAIDLSGYRDSMLPRLPPGLMWGPPTFSWGVMCSCGVATGGRVIRNEQCPFHGGGSGMAS
jgi:hypothetical protein